MLVNKKSKDIFVTMLLWSCTLAFLLSHNCAYAAWSDFKRITPDNISAQSFSFSLSKVKFTEQFQVTLNDKAVNNSKHDLGLMKSAWLVIASAPLGKEEQYFGDLLNSKYLGYSSKVILASKIGYSIDDLGQSVLQAYLHKSQLNKAYIYVGHIPDVSDGGLRYTIDIKSFYIDYLMNHVGD